MWQESRKGLSFNVPEEGDGPNGLPEDLGRPIYYSCFFLFSLVFSFFFLILLLYHVVLSTGMASPLLTALKTLAAAVTGGTLVIYY